MGDRWLGWVCEQLETLPPTIALALLWLVGVALLGSCALALYLAGSLFMQALPKA